MHSTYIPNSTQGWVCRNGSVPWISLLGLSLYFNVPEEQLSPMPMPMPLPPAQGGWHVNGIENSMVREKGDRGKKREEHIYIYI